MLVLMEQFRQGDQPNAKWFPKQEEWPALVAAGEKQLEEVPSSEASPAPRMKM
jgi:hypothetical protein